MQRCIARRLRRKAPSYQPDLFTRTHDIELRVLASRDLIPVGPTRWWEGVKTGEFPKPLKLAGRTVWRVSDINRLIEELDCIGPNRLRRRSSECQS